MTETAVLHDAAAASAELARIRALTGVSRERLRVHRDGTPLVLVPATRGTFGGPAETDGGVGFQADIAAFWLGAHPVTNAQYERFISATGHRPPDRASGGFPAWSQGRCPEAFADHPVTCVSWDDAQAYCRWAGLRLPGELEWELAAGGDGRGFPWGDAAEGRRRCRWDQNRQGGTTCGVCDHADGRSRWGLLQMAGNVWEWCEDDWRADTHRRRAAAGGGAWIERAVPGAEEPGKVIRGGSWSFRDGGREDYFRCAYRSDHCFAARRYDYLGFRVALDANASEDVR